ncbi:AzlD domain-containing protein, partial [Desulfovibrio sp. OttesenSCG-928-C06]|nr:AzlD domain-containing protein [Desulfovibrio sp. OttesenSCG-928-C06]
MSLHNITTIASDNTTLLAALAENAQNLSGSLPPEAANMAQSVMEATAAPVTGPISGPVFWGIVIAIAVGNYIMRAVFVFAMERIPMTENLKLILKYIPAAVLTALIAPAFVLHQGNTDFTSLTPLLEWLNGKERLLAGLAALGIALWKRSMMLIIL